MLHHVAADIDELRGKLGSFIDETTPLIPAGVEEQETEPTLGFRRVLQRALFHVQTSRKKQASGADVLIALFNEQESQAVFLLKEQSIARIDVVNYVAHGISKAAGETATGTETRSEGEEGGKESAPRALDTFATNLNSQARAGNIDPLVGRNDEVERVIQILCRRRKNNPLLVGESGVGKTAIAEGLAKRIVDNEVPGGGGQQQRVRARPRRTAGGNQVPRRFREALQGAARGPRQGRGRHPLHRRNPHHHRRRRGIRRRHGRIQPAQAPARSGDIRCMGSTTYQEYRGIFDKDRALSRRFQKIDIVEPDVDDTYRILKGLKSRFEDHYSLRYTDPACAPLPSFPSATSPTAFCRTRPST